MSQRFCVLLLLSGVIAHGEYAHDIDYDTHLGRALATARANVKGLAAEYHERGCHGNKADESCQHIERRRLGAEWLTNATHRRLNCAERIRAVEHELRANMKANEQPNMDKMMMYCKWIAAGNDCGETPMMCADAKNAWNHFFADERGLPANRRLQGKEGWRGVRLAAGRPWDNKHLKYAYHPEINSDAKDVFQSAIDELQGKTCITFTEVPHGSDETDVELISNEAGCWANVGKGNSQKSNLGSGCRWHGIALHELIHVLGATHEQNRADRDYFVTVDESVIDEGSLHNFKLNTFAYTSIGYDYRSIMHYGRYAFSTNWWAKDVFVGWTLGQLAGVGIDTGSPTIKSKNRRFVDTIGQRSHMSNNDLEQLLHMYQCEKVVLTSEEQPGAGVSWNRGIVFSWGHEGVDIACSGGLAPTSCQCHQGDGDCRGAMLTSMSGGACVAAGKKGASQGLTGQAICHKFASPHYMTARLSAEGAEGTASITCAGNYELLGCNCMTHEGDFCDAVPDLDSVSVNQGQCTARSTSSVTAQSVCVRAPAIARKEIVKGSEDKNSEAVCPEGMELTGCSCGGVELGKGHCAGAKTGGNHSNTCIAKGHSDKAVIAYAICAELLSNSGVKLPAAEHFVGGTLESDGALAPVQTVYLDGYDWSIGTTGFKAITMQRRASAAFNCSINCLTVDLTVKPETVQVVTKKADGAARCPGNWVVVNVECEDDCKRIKLTCSTPPPEAAWFLSGGVSYSPFFSGETESAMGTCGDALMIGVQCTDEAFFPTDACQKIQLICRRVGIASSDDVDARASFDVKLLDGTWSDWVSSTGVLEGILTFDFDDDQSLQNEARHPIQSVQCKGNACDDLKFFLPKKFGSFAEQIDLVGAPSITTSKFDSGEMACPDGHFVVGMRCDGDFCAKKALMCAEPAGDKWLLTGKPYYSFCFSNKEKYFWSKWIRDLGELIKGRSRLCVGSSYKDMPDKQSCGEDGLVVGLKCFGDHCASLQLMCATITANVDFSSQTILGNQEMKKEMIGLKIYNDPNSWSEQPDRDAGQPAKGLVWDRDRLIDSNLLRMGVAGARPFAQCGMAVFALIFIAFAA